MRILLALLTAGLVVGCTPGRGGGSGSSSDDDDSASDDDDATDDDDAVDDDDATDDDDASGNAWPTSQAPAGYAGTGGAVGDFAYDMAVMDQFGSSATLTQFYGAFVLVQFCSVWAGPCRAVGGDLQALHDSVEGFSSDWEFFVVTVLIESANFTSAGVGDAAAWALDYGLTEPVLVSPSSGQFMTQWDVAAYPTYFLLDPEFRIMDILIGGSVSAGWVQQHAADFVSANPGWTTPL